MHMEAPAFKNFSQLSSLFLSRWVGLGLGTQWTNKKDLMKTEKKEEEEGKVKDLTLPPQLFALLTPADFSSSHS